MRDWNVWAIETITAEANRSADTHLIRLMLPKLAEAGVDIYFKDESIHPSGSLKHRLARSLFLYALCNGWVDRDTTIVESSSGSTAVSEAYFAKLLGLPFLAVVPTTTAPGKLREIEFWGGVTHAVPADQIYAVAQELAQRPGFHYMDQFTYAERATDWRGNNNIAERLFEQMRRERHPVPHAIVVGAGTGGTSATIGRYIRYFAPSCPRTRLVVADPQGSVYAEYFRTGNAQVTSSRGRLIEGIGRPRVELSFLASVIDEVEVVCDQQSLAAMMMTSRLVGRRVGGSTGTNMVGVLRQAARMIARGEQGSIVSLICDPGHRYEDTYYSEFWRAAQGIDLCRAYGELVEGLGGLAFESALWRDSL